jgi:hypothetical protein
MVKAKGLSKAASKQHIVTLSKGAWILTHFFKKKKQNLDIA